MSGGPVLRLSDVSARYGDRTVFDGLSIDVHEGSLVGLLGPNGCGKTTVLRLASGWLAPAAGRVTVGGSDVGSLAPRDLARRVAVVPQEGGPVFSTSVLETVLLARYPWHPAFAFASGDDLAAAREALAEVDAVGLEERDLLTLSGGERQRVLIARALCQGGSLLLCDEPTAHLDVRHQVATFELLRALADRGRAVVVVTHDLDLAAQACDQIALLGEGGLVAGGTPREVITTENVEAAFGVSAEVTTDATGAPLVRRRLNSRSDGKTK